MNLMLEIFGGVLWCCWVLTSVSVWIWICFQFIWNKNAWFLAFVFGWGADFVFVGQTRVRVTLQINLSYWKLKMFKRIWVRPNTKRNTSVFVDVGMKQANIITLCYIESYDFFPTKAASMWVIIIDISTYVKAPDQTNLVHSSLDLTNLDLTK